MIPVNQTICNFKTGDCMRACCASIFELPIEQVPNFMEDGPKYFDKKLEDWLDGFGLIAVDIHKDYAELFKDCYIIATGISPRSIDESQRHAVIYLNNEMVHDPHPDNTGIKGELETFIIFIAKDPSKIIKNIKLETNIFNKEDLIEISLALEVQMKRVSKCLKDLSKAEKIESILKQFSKIDKILENVQKVYEKVQKELNS